MQLSIDEAHMLGHGEHVGLGIVLAPVVVEPHVPLLGPVHVDHVELELGPDGVLIATQEADVNWNVVAKVVPVLHVDLHVIWLDVFVITKLALGCHSVLVNPADVSRKTALAFESLDTLLTRKSGIVSMII